MRVHLRPQPAVTVAVVGLVGLSVLAVVLWLDRIAMPWPVGGFVVIASVGVLVCWLKARSGGAAICLSWDGQRWFASVEGQTAEPVAGLLALQLDFDGYSLLRFLPERPLQVGETPRWLMATPRNVQGPWQDWRAALIHAQQVRADP